MVEVTRVGGDVQVSTDSNDYPLANAPTIVRWPAAAVWSCDSESNNYHDGSGSDIRAEIFPVMDYLIPYRRL